MYYGIIIVLSVAMTIETELTTYKSQGFLRTYRS